MRLTLLSSEGYRLKEKNKTPKKKRRGPRVSIIFKSISGLAVLMIVFSVIVSIIGFNGFTQALMEQYYDGAVHTADTAIMILDSDRIDGSCFQLSTKTAATPAMSSATSALRRTMNTKKNTADCMRKARIMSLS